MSDTPESTDNGTKHQEAFKVVGAIIVLGFCMYYAWSFVGPSGQTTSIGSFIAFFFREVLLIGFLGLVLFVGCLAWLFGRVLKIFHQGNDAP